MERWRPRRPHHTTRSVISLRTSKRSGASRFVGGRRGRLRSTGGTPLAVRIFARAWMSAVSASPHGFTFHHIRPAVERALRARFFLRIPVIAQTPTRDGARVPPLANLRYGFSCETCGAGSCERSKSADCSSLLVALGGMRMPGLAVPACPGVKWPRRRSVFDFPGGSGWSSITSASRRSGRSFRRSACCADRLPR